MHVLIFDKQAENDLTGLPKELSQRIFTKLISTKENPHHFFVRLKGRNDYKLRIGDYRILAEIDDNKKEIFVSKIGHRKNIYDE